jgi:hypothetical protein
LGKIQAFSVVGVPAGAFSFSKIEDFDKIQAFSVVGVPAGAFSFSKKAYFYGF